MRLFLSRALPLLFSIIGLTLAHVQDDTITAALDALQRGDLSSAERRLRTELEKKTQDSTLLELLGVVLDQEKKYSDADDAYRRALSLAPDSSALLNNYGNHLMAMGRESDAQKIYLRVLALDPAHANAALQLAQIALRRKAPGEALKYLQALPSGTMAKDPRLNLAMGVALAGVGKYDRAEEFLSRVVESKPDDFEALYDLGLTASHAGHDEGARGTLQKALELQPENADVMYDLAVVDARLNRKEAALELLARADRIAPNRPEALFLLAHTSADLGYFGDAALAWERYLKLRPNDDVALREHAFSETALGENMQTGLADLEAFVRKHPTDAAGHYELAMAQIQSNQQQALVQLRRALELKPDLTAARVARGLLSYRQGKPEAALLDFQFAAKQQPENPAVLDRLGESYMALGRTQDALPVLKTAADLAPRDVTILLRYGRALSKAGEKDEARAIFARCRELGPARSALPHPAGLVDFLSLPPEEQRARYRAGVERTVARDPANAEAQVRYLELLLEDGKTGDARVVTQHIAELNPRRALVEEAARALAAAEQYTTLKEFIARIGNASSSELAIDLALADAHLLSPQRALEEIDRVPQAERNGDYYLARAEILEMAGEDPAAMLEQAMRQHPTRADLYRETAALFIKDHRAPEASRLLEEATRALPDDAELAVMKNALKTSASN